MADRGCHCAGGEAVALNVADADMAGVLVALHHGDLQHIVVHGDAVSVACIGGGNFAVDHADDTAGTMVGEILRRQLAYMEGVVCSCLQVGLYLGHIEILHHAVGHHQLALFIDLLNVEVFKVVDDDEVAEVTGCDSAAIVEEEVPRRIVAGGLNGGDGLHAERQGTLHDIVDVSLLEKIVGMLIVGAEHAPLHVFIAQQGSEGVQVPRRRTLADHNELAPLELGDGIVQVMTLVVGVHTCGDVGVEVVAHQVGGVTVDLLVVGLARHDFFHYLLITVDGAHEVHHLCQTLYAGMIVEAVNGAVVEVGARLIHGGSRDAGGQHKAHIHRQVLRGLQHVLNAVGAHDVGDLMGIGNDGGGAVGENCLGELLGAHQ